MKTNLVRHRNIIGSSRFFLEISRSLKSLEVSVKYSRSQKLEKLKKSWMHPCCFPKNCFKNHDYSTFIMFMEMLRVIFKRILQKITIHPPWPFTFFSESKIIALVFFQNIRKSPQLIICWPFKNLSHI